MLSELSLLESRLEHLRARGFTEQHRSVIDAQSAVTGQRMQIRDAVRNWLDQHGGQLASTSVGPTIPRLNPEQLRTAETSLATYQAMLDRAKARAAVLRTQCDDAAELATQIKKKEADKADIERRLTQIKTESGPNQSETRVVPISKGELPYKPYTDNRLKFAAIGMVLGGGIPLGLFLLWGFFDRRYRFSDEASSGRAHPTLLGILPYLPENIADPEQAAVAAHCVHQIRTLLQISGAHRGTGRGQVFAITSPTSGDGKTSLTLSLALSFASSGANTCAIDFDLVGGGLTSAMNAKTDIGLMDAIDRAELNGHIKPTGFKRLSIIPAGVNDAPEVSRLSPESVNRILDQARHQFDVVIVDTGPILGSLEASLVSAAADGVILTLGRGQARPLADRAMEFLDSVGATLLGVVFNRAQPGDFRRAVSSASVRSVPSQGAAMSGAMKALPAIGPMARTVASHIRPADTDAS
jgi:capsular exopolysaccharide synthesis family protein